MTNSAEVRLRLPEPILAAVLTCVGAAALHPDVVFNPNDQLLAGGRQPLPDVVL